MGSVWKNSRVMKLFAIQTPIVQAGMVYVSGGKLAAAAANSGALGLIGAGSFKPAELHDQIIKAKSLTNAPFGVNLPLLYHGVEEQIDIALKQGVRIFFTSAGSPKKYTGFLKDKGCVVVHVTSSPELAKKCEEAGVDAVVAEGFEAGGHNGRDEITTMVLIPQVVDTVKIPVIAAGGIGDGRGILAAMALGASGVQIGSRYAATVESSAHDNFKNAIVKAGPGDTMLAMKGLVPVRLLKNKFYHDIAKLELSGADNEIIKAHLGKGRARQGMLGGDLIEGELEIGQVSGMIKSVLTCQELMNCFVDEYQKARERI
ncbi:MAG: nitronate monooxygenase [Proteobacteria bacterium]|nr:nitronate monooxygenase [Pseudomonadota bacterium]